jgi:ankyrin repeat protein
MPTLSLDVEEHQVLPALDAHSLHNYAQISSDRRQQVISYMQQYHGIENGTRLLALVNKHGFERALVKELQYDQSSSNVHFLLRRGRLHSRKDTCLEIAAKLGYEKTIRWLLENGAQRMVLNTAASCGKLNAVNELLRWQHADEKSLVTACSLGHLEIGKALMQHINENRRCWIGAARNGNEEVIDYLLATSTCVNCHTRSLREAARNGHTNIAEKLLAREQPNGEEICEAACEGNVETLQLLLQHYNGCLNKPLSLAIIHGQYCVIEMLHRNYHQQDALPQQRCYLNAARRGWTQVLKTVIEYQKQCQEILVLQETINACLKEAADHDKSDTAIVLIPYIDDTVTLSKALARAANNTDEYLVDALLCEGAEPYVEEPEGPIEDFECIAANTSPSVLKKLLERIGRLSAKTLTHVACNGARKNLEHLLQEADMYTVQKAFGDSYLCCDERTAKLFVDYGARVYAQHVDECEMLLQFR